MDKIKYVDLMNELKRTIENGRFNRLKEYADVKYKTSGYNKYLILTQDPRYLRKFPSGEIEFKSEETKAILFTENVLDYALDPSNVAIDDIEKLRYELLRYFLFDRPDIIDIICQKALPKEPERRSFDGLFFKEDRLTEIFKLLSEENKQKLLSEGEKANAFYTYGFRELDIDFWKKLSYYMQYLESDESRMKVINKRIEVKVREKKEKIELSREIEMLAEALQLDESKITVIQNKLTDERYITKLAKTLKLDKSKMTVINNNLSKEEYITELAKTLQSDELKMKAINNKLSKEEYITQLAETLESDELKMNVIKNKLTNVYVIIRLATTLKSFENKFKILVNYYENLSDANKKELMDSMTDDELKALIMNQDLNIQLKRLAIKSIKDMELKKSMEMILAIYEISSYYKSEEGQARQNVMSAILEDAKKIGNKTEPGFRITGGDVETPET